MESYETLRRVGRGHHGTAWLVRDVRDGRHYCLKQINLESYDETERSQAAGEVSLLRSLDHPCIVRYREHFLNAEGMLCLVMTFCEGGDLASAIRTQKETGALFGEEQVLDWFAQLALALGHTHERRILHRDIKTQNVFLTRGSLVKLGDFGIARVLDGSQSHAQTVVGTPFYMSPEVCQNRPYSYKSDVWALGCVLYELLALKQAWDGSNLLGLVYKIVQQTYEPPPVHYSPELRALLAAMLAKEPDARPSVAQILNEPLVRTAVQSIADREAPPAGAPLPAAPSPSPSLPQLMSVAVLAGTPPLGHTRGALGPARVSRRPHSGGNVASGGAGGRATPPPPPVRAASAAAGISGGMTFSGSPLSPERLGGDNPGFEGGGERRGCGPAGLTPAQRMRARKLAAADEAASELTAAAAVQRASQDAAARRGRLQFETSGNRQLAAGRVAAQHDRRDSWQEGSGEDSAASLLGMFKVEEARHGILTSSYSPLNSRLPALGGGSGANSVLSANSGLGGNSSLGGKHGYGPSSPGSPPASQSASLPTIHAHSSTHSSAHATSLLSATRERHQQPTQVALRNDGAPADLRHSAGASSSSRSASRLENPLQTRGTSLALQLQAAGEGAVEAEGEYYGDESFEADSPGSAAPDDDSQRLSRLALKQLHTLPPPRRNTNPHAGPVRESREGREGTSRSRLSDDVQLLPPPGLANATSFRADAQPLEDAHLPPRNEYEPRHSAAERVAALKAACVEALGDAFEPVYTLLKGHHQRQDGADVRPALVALVGRDRLRDCFGVDQLIFQSELSSRRRAELEC